MNYLQMISYQAKEKLPSGTRQLLIQRYLNHCNKGAKEVARKLDINNTKDAFCTNYLVNDGDFNLITGKHFDTWSSGGVEQFMRDYTPSGTVRVFLEKRKGILEVKDMTYSTDA